ncbi:MAG: gliding motility-associated C-terminal domain-containing protein [Bacteroidota bacterium]|nr:gliding motility-associated C-terminal domain-containing protein [Bacteroidota bacterium]
MMAIADAGSNAFICKEDSIQIGVFAADSGVAYSWYPPTGLSDPTSANPWAKPDSTTIYVLTISDPNGLYCLGNSTDSVTVTVNDCPVPPEYFVPGILKGDERFTISALPQNTSLKIFDLRGRLIYNAENYQNDFSVTHLAAGIYVYRLRFADGSLQEGKVCVIE